MTFSARVNVYRDPHKTVEYPSGVEFPVSELPGDLYLEGVEGSTAFKDVELKAEYVGPEPVAPDTVKVTVFEVTLTAFTGFGAKQGDDEVDYEAAEISSSNNGIISWDDKDANGSDGTDNDKDPNCRFFHNIIEIQGTLKPAKQPMVPYPVGFDFTRAAWVKGWEKKDPGDWMLVEGGDSWVPDDSHNTDEDLTAR